VRGTDGRFHLAYELVLTNATPLPVEVGRVAVRDSETHRVLLSLGGEELASRMNPIGGTPLEVTPPPPSLLAPGGSAVVWLDVRLKNKWDVPNALEHLVAAATRPVTGAKSLRFSSLVGRVAVQDREPLELGAPARGGIWVADEGCCDFDTHHRRRLLVVDGNEVRPAAVRDRLDAP